MRAFKPTAAMRKRLASLEVPETPPEPTGGFMVVPREMSLDEWESFAVPMHNEALRHHASEEEGKPNFTKEQLAAFDCVVRIY